MSYRDIWTDEHGEDGLREKFSVYKTCDRDYIKAGFGIGEAHLYAADALVGATGEFMFVLRPESDEAAWISVNCYADCVEHRSPKLAEDIRAQVRRIKLHQDQSHD